MAARTPPEKLAEMVALQSRGYTQDEIADTLAVCEKTVRRHLRTHNRKVSEALEEEAVEARARQIAQLSWMLSQALRGWEKSLQDAEAVKETTGGKEGGKVERTAKGQSGNPAHLTAAVAILANLQKLYRLDAEGADPAEAEVVARDQVARVILDALADLPDEARDRVGARLARTLLEGSLRGRNR